MKFFIDENLTPAIADSLNLVFRSHVFRSVSDEDLGGRVAPGSLTPGLPQNGA